MATGAMSTTPGLALNAMLNLPPLHMQIQAEAKQAVLRIANLGLTNWKSQSLRSFQDSVLSVPTLGMSSDYTSCLNFNRLFSLDLPSREDWTSDLVTWQKGSMKWFTDGSKSGACVGSGIYGERPKHKSCRNLGKFASIFQAEVYAILECAEINLNKPYSNQCIYIHSDSKAALLALNSDIIKSKLVQNCVDTLNRLGSANKVILRWVPGHSGIEGNEQADEQARKGAEGTFIGPEPFFGIPKSLTTLSLRQLSASDSTRLWNSTTGSNHARKLIKGFNVNFTKNLIALSKNNSRIITRVLTGHCLLNKHAHSIGLTDSPLCRFCEEADETPLHILCDCGPWMRSRSQLLGSHLLSPEDVKKIKPKDLLQFWTATGLVDDL